MKDYITPELIALIIVLYVVFKAVRCICDTIVAKEYIKMIVNKNVLEKRPHIKNNRYISNVNTPSKSKIPSNYDDYDQTR